MLYLKRYRAFMATIVLLAAGVAQAANLHLVIWAETLDPSIGTIQDVGKAKSWGRTIEANTGLKLVLHTLSDQNLTPAAGRYMLSTLNPATDDVVYFVYSGHGANFGNTEWPTFTFLTQTGDPSITFDEVVATLQPKPQRLLLVIADCCNVRIDASGRSQPASEPSADTALTLVNFQHLFLDFRGTIIATAADVGQYSLGDSSEGGLFLNGFMETFKALADTTSGLTWDTILDTTVTDVKNVAAMYLTGGGLGDIAPQEAQYVVNAEQVAAETPPSPDTPTSSDSTGGSTDNSTTGDTGSTTGDTGPTAGDTGSATDDTDSADDNSTSSGDSTAVETHPSPSTEGAACGAIGPLPLAGMAVGLLAAFVRRRRD